MPQDSSALSGWFVKVTNEGHEKFPPCKGVFLDDVIVFDLDPASYVETIRGLFLHLRQHNLKLSPTKSQMGWTAAAFLGPTISPSGVNSNAEQVAPLVNMPIPREVKQLRSLLDGLSVDRKFQPNLAKGV